MYRYPNIIYTMNVSALMNNILFAFAAALRAIYLMGIVDY